MGHGMVTNRAKTKLISIHANNESPIELNDPTVHQIDSYTYLGSPVLNNSLKSQTGVHINSKQSCSRKFSLLLAQNHDAPSHVKHLFWNAALNGAILYRYETWFTHSITLVESSYMHSLKDLQGVQLQTVNDAWLSVELSLPNPSL